MLGVVEVEGLVDCAVEERGEGMCNWVAEEIADFFEVVNGFWEGRVGGEGEGFVSFGGGLLSCHCDGWYTERVRLACVDSWCIYYM